MEKEDYTTQISQQNNTYLDYDNTITTSIFTTNNTSYYATQQPFTAITTTTIATANTQIDYSSPFSSLSSFSPTNTVNLMNRIDHVFYSDSGNDDNANDQCNENK